MAGSEIAATLFSNLFRLSAYVFLRVIPARPFKFLLPGTYLAYLICYFLSPPAVPYPATAVVIAEKPAGENGKLIGNGTQVTTAPALVKPAPKTRSSSLSTILFSLPSPLRRQRLINFAINTILLHCAVDFVTYPFFDSAPDVAFTRVGAVYSDASKLVVRYPFANATEGTVQVVWRQTLESAVEHAAWKDGPVVTLSRESDWTATTKLTGLWPSTVYEYRLADAEKYMLPVPAQPIVFRTFPDPRLPTGNHFRFVVASCTTPNFPYLPFHGRAIRGFDLLADYLWPAPPAPHAGPETLSMEDLILGRDVPDAPAPVETASVETETMGAPSETEASEAPLPTEEPWAAVNETVAPATAPPAEFMLFLGDFVYADVPVYFGDDREAYRRLYRRNYNSPSFRKVYEKLPIFHTYDDHEIINNFAGLANDSSPPYPNASDAYTIYNSIPNYDPLEAGQHYYDFRYGDVAFFVMDTRKYRSDVFTEDVASRTMLGDKQLTALYEWLGKVNSTATFKFIVSSVPFTTLWQHDALTDSWAGFTHERTALLNVMHTVPNVVVLSGDRHEFAAIEFSPEQRGAHPVFEMSTSPLSMFYIPFVRTLKSESDARVLRARHAVEIDEDGLERVVETEEEVPQEKVLKYIAKGNYKWSAIEIDSRNLDKPLLKLELVSDGRVKYNLEIAGAPVKLKSSTALGAFVPQSFAQIMDKIGLNPSKWF